MDAVAVKAALRRDMLARLRALTVGERLQASGRLLQALASSSEWRQARSVLLFAPLPTEPNLDALWTRPGGPLTGKVCFYPRVEGNTLVACRVRGPGDLVASTPAQRLREPSAACPALRVPPDPAPDLVLVPGLAFTAEGGRLGRGGGFYDRLLRAGGPWAGCRTLGLGFACQRVAALPREGHDRSLDSVLFG